MNFLSASLNNEFLTFINNDLTIEGELFVNKIKTDDITTTNLIVNGITTSNLIVNDIQSINLEISNTATISKLESDDITTLQLNNCSFSSYTDADGQIFITNGKTIDNLLTNNPILTEYILPALQTIFNISSFDLTNLYPLTFMPELNDPLNLTHTTPILSNMNMKKITQTVMLSSLFVNCQLGMDIPISSQPYITKIYNFLGNGAANDYFNSTLNLKVKIVASNTKTDTLNITSLNDLLTPVIRTPDFLTRSVILSRGLNNSVMANPNILSPLSMIFTDLNGYLITPLSELPYYIFLDLPGNVKLNDRIGSTERRITVVENINRIISVLSDGVNVLIRWVSGLEQKKFITGERGPPGEGVNLIVLLATAAASGGTAGTAAALLEIGPAITSQALLTTGEISAACTATNLITDGKIIAATASTWANFYIAMGVSATVLAAIISYILEQKSKKDNTNTKTTPYNGGGAPPPDNRHAKLNFVYDTTTAIASNDAYQSAGDNFISGQHIINSSAYGSSIYLNGGKINNSIPISGDVIITQNNISKIILSNNFITLGKYDNIETIIDSKLNTSEANLLYQPLTNMNLYETINNLNTTLLNYQLISNNPNMNLYETINNLNTTLLNYQLISNNPNMNLYQLISNNPNMNLYQPINNGGMLKFSNVYGNDPSNIRSLGTKIIFYEAYGANGYNINDPDYSIGIGNSSNIFFSVPLITSNYIFYDGAFNEIFRINGYGVISAKSSMHAPAFFQNGLNINTIYQPVSNNLTNINTLYELKSDLINTLTNYPTTSATQVIINASLMFYSTSFINNTLYQPLNGSLTNITTIYATINNLAITNTNLATTNANLATTNTNLTTTNSNITTMNSNFTNLLDGTFPFSISNTLGPGSNQSFFSFQNYNNNSYGQSLLTCRYRKNYNIPTPLCILASFVRIGDNAIPTHMLEVVGDILLLHLLIHQEFIKTIKILTHYINQKILFLIIQLQIFNLKFQIYL